MTSVKWFLLITDLLFLHEKQALTLNLHVIILLLCRTLTQTATSFDAPIWCDRRGFDGRAVVVSTSLVTTTSVSDILALLFLFLLALLTPYFIHV